MEAKNQEINSSNLELSPAVAKGSSDQTNAHSLGIMFEQSISQQQNHFQTAISTSATEVNRILNLKKNKLNRIEKIKQHRFFNL